MNNNLSFKNDRQFIKNYRNETNLHIEDVNYLLEKAALSLSLAGKFHDRSKFDEPADNLLAWLYSGKSVELRDS